MIRRIKKTTETTPISSEVVNTFSNSTKNAYACGYINDLVEEVYSTDEVKTNKVWIDGKPIYKKVTNFTNKLISRGANNLATGISNMETLIDSKLYMKYNNTWFADWLDNGFVNKTYTSNGSNYRVDCSSDLTAQQLILITEYTKTTDNN